MVGDELKYRAGADGERDGERQLKIQTYRQTNMQTNILANRGVERKGCRARERGNHTDT